MFGWPKKGNPPASETLKNAPPAAAAPATKPSKDDLIREALMHTAAARSAIGEEALGKLNEIMRKKAEAAQFARARTDLINAVSKNSEHMSFHIKEMMADKNSGH